MPRIIRQALGERIRRDPELQALLENVRRATGVCVEFVGPLGHRDESFDNGSPLCAQLRREPAGCRLCTHFHQTLLADAHDNSVTRTCDAGLCESAVPFRAGGHTLGYFVASGYAAAATDVAQLNRARHLLGCAGVRLSAEQLAAVYRQTAIVPAERQAAIVRLLHTLTEHLAHKLMPRLASPSVMLPPLIDEACRIVNAEFAHPLSIAGIAKRLRVSDGHLSRSFHRATGLRFVEYIARFRAERARALVIESGTPITEIAFACGFQSLSQFNRVFRAQFGQSPTQVRHAARQ